MCRATPVLPKTTYASSMRCIDRTLRLTPNRAQETDIKQIYTYCLAYAASSFGVEVHAYAVMGNHIHEVYTDVEGADPSFRQLKNSLIARAVNKYQGRKGTLWMPSDRGVQVLLDAPSQLDSYAYVGANPVKHRLVRRSTDWPGARSRPADLGKEVVIRRPPWVCANLPEEVRLTLTAPPAVAHLGAREAVEVLGEAVRTKEEVFRKLHEKAAANYLGRKRIRRQRVSDRPRKDPQTAATSRSRIRCADKVLRSEWSASLRAFRKAHAEAVARIRDGDWGVVFPHGTWGVRHRFAVLVHPGPRREAEAP